MLRTIRVFCVWIFLEVIYSTNAACPQAPGTGPYTFTATVPDNCQQQNCDYYVATKIHSSDPTYVDFWIEGTAAGYVALGLSSSGGMADSDVLACAIDQTAAGGVSFVDTYNINAQSYSNQRDNIQNLCPYSANFTNGRIYCSNLAALGIVVRKPCSANHSPDDTFGRLIDTGDTLQDKTLNASYTLLYAAVNNAPAGSGSSLNLQYHAAGDPVKSLTALRVISQPPTAQTPTVQATATAQTTPNVQATPIPTAQATTMTTPSSLTCPAAPGSEPYRFIATIPDNCTRASCSYYFAVKTSSYNPLYLDFVLEGNAKGYVAVGFSPNGLMALSDVLACAIDSSSAGGAAVVDAYNTAGYSDVRDTVQNVCPHTAMVVNGRISCSFSRLIDTGDTPQDKNLNASYYLLYAAVDNQPGGSGSTLRLSQHSQPQTPTATTSPVNIVIASGAAVETPTAQATTMTTPSSLGCPAASGSEPYRFIATIPDNCTRASCSYYFAVKTSSYNPLYLDFVLEGNAKGYVAVGFSPNGNMALSDVLACAIDSSSAGGAAVVDAYNTAGYSDVRDTVQNVCQHTAMVANGRISCSFSRLIDTGDTLQDKTLNASYYLLYAAVNNQPVGSGSTLRLSQHSQNPIKTASPVNIVTASGAAVAPSYPRQALTKIHAILMLIAWPLLATTGIFFAAWMKPALPPPPLPATWFKVHRFLMLASLFIGAAGFVFIFAANAPTKGLIAFANRPSAIAHFAIGILVMALHVANPIISAFRCSPDHPRRWIFNLLHGSIIGTGVQLLALANCGIGASLYDSTTLYYIFWVYLAFAVWTFIVLVALFLVFTGIAISVGGQEGPKLGPAMIKPILTYYFGKKSDTGSTVQMVALKKNLLDDNAVQKKEHTSLTDDSKPTTMAKNIVLRWISLASLLSIVIPFIIVLVVLIAIQ